MTTHITIPVFNEEMIIERKLQTLFHFLKNTPVVKDARVIVADNGSEDRTRERVEKFRETHPTLTILSVPTRGKGQAVLTAWERYPADINIFLDADLAAGLDALPALVQAICDGSDVAVGSRAVLGAVVYRNMGRRLFSFGLRTLLFVFFRLHVRDAPCGMKAVSRRVLRDVLPLIHDRGWFFDTELLIRAERKGYRIEEVPVTWSDAADRERPSRVTPLTVTFAYLRAMIRLRRSL